MTELPFWIAALLAGFFGSTHCVGMCGGIAGVLTHAVRNKEAAANSVLQLGFHFGRITSYCVLALALGGLLQSVSNATALQWWADLMRALAALMLIMMGLYLTRWWNGLTALERLGARLWARIQPTFLRRSSAMNQTFLNACISGVLWGLLPCGLVYSALMTASLQADWLRSGLFMLLFGLGTVPALLLSGLAVYNAAQLQRWRVLGGLLLITFGVIVLSQLAPALFASDNDIHQHEHHHQMSMT